MMERGLWNFVYPHLSKSGHSLPYGETHFIELVAIRRNPEIFPPKKKMHKRSPWKLKIQYMNTNTARKPNTTFRLKHKYRQNQRFSRIETDRIKHSYALQLFAFLPFRIYIFQYILYISYLSMEENLLGLQEMVFVLVKNKPQGGFSRTENVRIYHSHS